MARYNLRFMTFMRLFRNYEKDTGEFKDQEMFIEYLKFVRVQIRRNRRLKYEEIED